MKLPKVSVVRWLAWVALFVYGALLLKVVLFKYPGSRISLEAISIQQLHFRLRYAANFTPLKTVLWYLRYDPSSRITLWNLAGNLALLAPLGCSLPYLFPGLRTVRQIAVTAFTVSLFLEVVQLLTGLGSFDVDDLLLNVIGAMLGWLVYRRVTRRLRRVRPDKTTYA